MKSWHPAVKWFAISGVLVIGGIEIYDRSFGELTQPTIAIASTASIEPMRDLQRLPDRALYPELHEFTETISRPLFASERRVVLIEDSPAQATTDDDEIVIHYVGSIRTEQHMKALINHEGIMYSIVKGDEVAGWKAISIESRRIVVMRADEQRELKLFELSSADLTGNCSQVDCSR